ncbi:hypothetical protein ACN4EE_23020 [Geminocystis sp. CENA526]|uniref:hypothetical protein n=1 Tax=Geminocystis sp. CENA526 TaxID=1355871 RepID=UPI003D6E9F38
MEYQYFVTIKDMIYLSYIEKLTIYLKSILSKIKKGENIKVILNSDGGETDYMRKILSLLREIHDKGAILDIYCKKTKSAALIMLVLLKNENRLNKVYGYENSFLMWHKPKFFVEFDGELVSKNRFVFEGNIDYLLFQTNEFVNTLQEIDKDYKVCEDIYLDIITKAIISNIKKEIEEEIHFTGRLAKYRGIINEIVGDKFID